MTLARWLVALCLLAVTARAALAEEPERVLARQHFERGEKLYVLARFSEALDEYQKAFDAAPLAGFLFNIGQCHRNLGDYDSAVFSYRQYLKLAPTAPNRSQVEQLIGELEAKRDQRAAERATQQLGLERPRPAPLAAPAPGGERHAVLGTWWFWTAVAAVAVGTGSGIAIYERSRPTGAPATDLGNIVFGK